MKYAREVIDLMAVHPGREFRMAEIVRYVCGGRRLPLRETEAVRKGVWRVLVALEEGGQVWRRADCDKSAVYAWAVSPQTPASYPRSRIWGMDRICIG